MSRNQTIPGRNGPLVAAQEERGGDGADDEHVRVLGEEKEGEPHARVFGVVARHELALRLGQVEGGPVGLGDAADEIDQKATGWYTTNHSPFCASTIAFREKELAIMITGRSARRSGIS